MPDARQHDARHARDLVLHGVDFSGSRSARRKIWAATLEPGSAASTANDVDHAGLVRRIAGSADDGRRHAWVIDAPFTLAAAQLDAHGVDRTWRATLGWLRSFDSPRDWRRACRKVSRKEPRRGCDLCAKTPLAPSNLRLFKQTWHCIVSVLGPLSEVAGVALMPMDAAARPDAPVAVAEACPSSTLRHLGWPHAGYKGPSDKNVAAREEILRRLERDEGIAVEPGAARRALEDAEGDALDSLILLSAARRFASTDHAALLAADGSRRSRGTSTSERPAPGTAGLRTGLVARLLYAALCMSRYTRGPIFPRAPGLPRPPRFSAWRGRSAVVLRAIGVCLLIAVAVRVDAVDFMREVRPILERSCVRCHAGGKRRGGLRIDTRETLLEGGKSGPAVVAGKAGESLLVRLISGDDPERVMPDEGERLGPEEIAVLRAWIDGGLEWPAGFTFGKASKAPVATSIAPRRPELPPAPGDSSLDNPIDRLLAPYFRDNGVEFPGPVDDRTFARRVFLDVIGLLPSPEEVDRFEKSDAPDARERLVRDLLGRRREYAEHWMTFWNDALRNAYRGTGFIDGGRKQLTGWLFAALYHNIPYDRFVRELIDPVDGSEGFVKGIIWRGTVNASQRKEMQAAQNVAQVFLGTNLKCASCHDSFVNDWKLADAYALASVFAEKPLELHRCNEPIGEVAAPAAPFAELGEIDAEAPREARMRRLAELLASRENGRLARTMVNRLWASFFGRGLVEPVDEMENEPWHRDLLDWLAADLADSGFDIKRTIELICTSRAYASSSVGEPAPGSADPVFRGPLVRRMTAEQFVDALGTLTGEWTRPSDALTKIDGRGQGGQLAAVRAVLESQGEDATPRPLRAVVAHDDQLQRALGRPNREQVVTRRDSVATTLQALELTNGDTLASILQAGARRWLEDAVLEDAVLDGDALDGSALDAGRDGNALLDAVFRLALARAPDDVERETLLAVIGSPPDTAGVEDLLWIVAMLPEFQLIR